MLKFNTDFFKDEEREGFLVKSMVKRAWASQLEIIRVIDEICKKYAIQYFVFWGSLLGAVRHKGFVPWDDDFDIIMKRPDYFRFITVAKFELPRGYHVLNLYTDSEWDDLISRVVNGEGIDFSQEFLDKNYGCPYTCGVDIFPYDYMLEDPQKQKELDIMMRHAIDTIEAQMAVDEQISIRHYADKKLEKTIAENLEYYERKYKFKFKKSNNLSNQLFCLFDQLAQSYGSKDAKYMTCYAERRKRYKDNSGDFIIPSFCLDEAIDMPFENIMVKVPKYYELCLTRCYGRNYMTPIKSTAAHEYPFFLKQERIARDAGKYDDVMNAVKLYEIRESELETVGDFIYIIESEDIEYKEAVNQEIAELRNLIAEWKGPDKKVIIYCTSIMDVYENEEKALDKIQNTISFLESKTDYVCTILLIAPYVDEILARKGWKYADRYNSILNDVMQSDWCLAIFPEQLDGIIDLCDAYYGSGNEYIKSFQELKKPVMVQDINIMNV